MAVSDLMEKLHFCCRFVSLGWGLGSFFELFFLFQIVVPVITEQQVQTTP
jgi:hypothetical protein